LLLATALKPPAGFDIRAKMWHNAASAIGGRAKQNQARELTTKTQSAAGQTLHTISERVF
jgi:hypothetical protein